VKLLETFSTNRVVVADDICLNIAAPQEWPANDRLLSQISGRLHGLSFGEESEAGTCAPASRHPCRNFLLMVRDREGGRIWWIQIISRTESGKAELAEVEKEEIDAYYGCFVPLRRASDIKEMRPEDALDASAIAAACGRQLQALQILNSSFFSRLYGRRSTSKDKGDNEQNQKDDKQHVGDPRRFTGHTA